MDRPYDMEWSCRKTKRINIGDIFFLMRLAVEPKGIIACGYIISEPYLLHHWNEEKAKENIKALRTDLLFKTLSEKPIISLDYLQNNYPNYKWTPQTSGLSIPESIASDLFSKIQQEYKFSFTPATEKEIRFYTEGKVKEITTKTYDRNPLARQVCIEYHGYTPILL